MKLQLPIFILTIDKHSPFVGASSAGAVMPLFTTQENAERALPHYATATSIVRVDDPIAFRRLLTRLRPAAGGDVFVDFRVAIDPEGSRVSSEKDLLAWEDVIDAVAK